MVLKWGAHRLQSETGPPTLARLFSAQEELKPRHGCRGGEKEETGWEKRKAHTSTVPRKQCKGAQKEKQEPKGTGNRGGDANEEKKNILVTQNACYF